MTHDIDRWFWLRSALLPIGIVGSSLFLSACFAVSPAGLHPLPEPDHLEILQSAEAPIQVSRPQLKKLYDDGLRSIIVANGRLAINSPRDEEDMDGGVGGGDDWSVRPGQPSGILQDSETSIPDISGAYRTPSTVIDGLVSHSDWEQGSGKAVSFDPGFGPTPLRTPRVEDCASDPLGKGFGRFECYRLIVYTRMNPKKGQQRSIHMARVVVVVEAFDAKTGLRLSHPSVRFARFSKWPDGFASSFRPLYDSDGDLLAGFELTSTNDGRLIVYQSFSDKVGKGHHFTFNSDPAQSPNAWSPPQPLSNLNTWSGRPLCLLPGVALSECPAAQKASFGEIFPIARQPIRMPDGAVVPNGKPFLCLYPWIDFDGANIFCGMISPRDKPAMFGQDTGGTVKLIDGPFNPIPATSDCGVRPDFLVRDNKRCPGNTRATGIGRTSGMWSLFHDEPHRKLPFFRSESAHSTLLRIADGYVVYDEVNADDFDAKNILYLAMTPTIRWVDELRDGKNTQVIEEDTTPDTSGRFHLASINNPRLVQFPDSYLTSLSKSSPQLETHEFVDSAGVKRSYQRLPNPWVGYGLFFRPGGKITVRPTGLDAPLDAERRDLSLSFALMPMAGVYEKIENNNTSVRLLGKNGQWTFLLNKRGRLEIQFQMQRGRIQLEVPQALAEQRWHHISASVNASVEQKATFRVYLNGALVVFVRGESEDDLLLGGHEPLVIGNELSFAGDALVQLDSVRISDGILDPTEVRREAFVRMPATHFAAPNPLPSALGSIPIGLDPRSGHVPRELAPWIGGPLESSLPSLVQLGDRLFDSVLLSTNSRRNPSQDKACSSCHQKSKGLSDGLRVAEGRTGLLSRNSSSVLNRLWGTEQFWDGSARSLVEQATMPITNVEELDGNPKEVLAALQESNMRGLFERAFGLTPKESLQMRQVALALAAYQLTLVSNASFADSVQINGSDSKIQRGRELFFGKARCFGCHSGTTLSDESFHVTGVGGADLGRSRVTDRVRDRRAFKTPTLRGIEQSAPYFHDGRAGTLADVILFYDKGGGDVPSNAVKDVDLFPLHLTPQERVDLEAFLRGL